MKDRISTYPGRVKLNPVADGVNTYDLVRADEPKEEGTPLTKANLLSDETAAVLGLGDNESTVNSAFLKIGKTLPALATRTEIFTEDGVFRVPEGVTSVRVMCYGGGGAGGEYGSNSNTSSYYGGGGGGGYYAESDISVTPGEHIPITIGLGGISDNGYFSSNGGTTSFGTYLSADGGEAGTAGGGDGGTGGSGGSGGGGGTTNYSNMHANGGRGYQFGGGGGGSPNYSYLATQTVALGGSMGGAGGINTGAGSAGVDTTNLDVPFPGVAPGGSGSDSGRGSGGGGGYGSAGGKGTGGGGGGGGYGGDGGDGGTGGSAAGGGGGGYGPNGKGGSAVKGSNYGIERTRLKRPIDGGIGAGGAGGSGSSNSTDHYAGKGGDGICTVTYTLPV